MLLKEQTFAKEKQAMLGSYLFAPKQCMKGTSISTM
jgi:hypothetical protein